MDLVRLILSGAGGLKLGDTCHLEAVWVVFGATRFPDDVIPIYDRGVSIRQSDQGILQTG
jgi:hypothetical protein